MSVERNYRNESRLARQEARKTLAAFREARMRTKRGGGDTHKPGKAITKTNGQSLISPETFFSMDPTVREDAQENSAAPEFPDLPEGFDEQDTAVHAGEDATDLESCPDELEESAEIDPPEAFDQVEKCGTATPEAMTASSTVEPACVVEEDDTPAADHAVQRTSALATVDPDSDLFELPCAGAGMIWLFHQCGIQSLADLAHADPRDLSLRLGVVGHILSVEPWITFARQKIDQDDPNLIRTGVSADR